MNQDFDRVNAALVSSVPGRLVVFLEDAIRSAWRSSSTGAASRSIGGTLRTMPAAERIRAIAVAVFIAAALQPLLIGAMPAAAAPALPWPAFAIVAGFAAVIAWKAEAFVSASRGSRLARWIRN
jgi:hypothetical protein